MNRTCTPIIAGMVFFSVVTANLCGQSKPPSEIKPHAVGKSATANDALRTMLGNQGYTAVPLIQSIKDDTFFVECKSGGESWLMKLDTSTQATCLDKRLAKKLGLSLDKEIPASNNSGVLKVHPVSLNQLSIGDFNMKKLSLSYELFSFDCSSANVVNGSEQKEIRQIDGILGQNTLQQLSAVIDYATRTLYLQPPIRRLWPKIEGKWVAERVEDNGEMRTIDAQSPPTLEFKNDHIYVTNGKNKYEFAFHALSFEHGYRIAMYDPSKELEKVSDYETGGILKIEDGVLTVCLCLDSKNFKGMPKDFSTSSDDGYILLQCRFVK